MARFRLTPGHCGLLRPNELRHRAEFFLGWLGKACTVGCKPIDAFALTDACPVCAQFCALSVRGYATLFDRVGALQQASGSSSWTSSSATPGSPTAWPTALWTLALPKGASSPSSRTSRPTPPLTTPRDASPPRV